MTTRRLLFPLLLAVSAATMSADGGTEPPDNKGTDFFIAFPQNVTTPSHPSHRLTLFIAAEGAARVEISGPEVVTALFDIPQSSVVEVFFGTTALQLPGGVSNKGIRVRSIDPLSGEGAPIAVFGLNRRVATAGAYLALPVDVLGTQYRALTQVGTAVGPGSQVTIVGTEDNTVVRITTPIDVPGVTTAGVAHEVVLNRLQTFLLQLQVGDLTGTVVSADKPVAVFGGNQNSAVTAGSPDHMVEQMIPVSAWGDEFVVAPIATIPPRTAGDIVRVLAHEDETAVEVNGEPKTVLGAGQVYEFVQPSPSGSWIQTSKPSLVAHYNRGDLLQTSPFVMLVPPVREFSSQYLFRTPRFTTPGENHWLNIVVRDGDEAGLLLNGAALPSSAVWTSVNGYRYARVTIPAGTGQRLEHQEPTVQFGAWAYGHAAGEAYGYTAGQLVEDKTPPSIFSLPGDQTIEATGPNGATVTWADPSATDFGHGELPVTCTPQSGSMIALGTHVVECSAADPAGNRTAVSFTVTVQDTTPPELALPDDIVVHATEPEGAVVNYDKVTAFDLVDLHEVTIHCEPPSGSTFPLGPGYLTSEPAIVSCTATDRSGNTTRSASTTLSASTTRLPNTFTVTVTNKAPVCSAARPSMSTIPHWRRGFVPIIIRGVTDPDQDKVRIRIVGIFQDEPVSRRRDTDDDDDVDKAWRHLSFDGFGLGTRVARIRAERSQRGNGRVYHIRFTARDTIGASCNGEVTVGVPRHRDGAAVDSDALYDSTGGFRAANRPGNPNHGRRNDDEEEHDH